MRVETITRNIYTFAELTGTARQNATDAIIEALADDRYEAARETVLWALAERLKTPGWDEYGPGDFPGIGGLDLVDWDIDRGYYVALSGEFNEDNAPGLPWPRLISRVQVSARRSGTSYDEFSYDEDYADAQGLASHAWIEARDKATEQIESAIDEAITYALSVASKEYDHQLSDEYIAEVADGNEWEFLEDGTWM
jgi:hypothetical protein